MGVYIDAWAVWESNVIGAPWYSAAFKLVLMVLLLAVVLVVLAVEVEWEWGENVTLRANPRADMSERDSEVVDMRSGSD
jgi:hypothetical protein